MGAAQPLQTAAFFLLIFVGNTVLASTSDSVSWHSGDNEYIQPVFIESHATRAEHGTSWGGSLAISDKGVSGSFTDGALNIAGGVGAGGFNLNAAAGSFGLNIGGGDGGTLMGITLTKPDIDRHSGLFAPPPDTSCKNLAGLKGAIMKVTGECSDRSFGTLCLPGSCREQLELIMENFDYCSAQLEDDIQRTIGRDWNEIQREACKADPTKRKRLAVQFLGNFEQPPLTTANRNPADQRIGTPDNGDNGVPKPFDAGQPNLSPQDMLSMQRLSIRSPAPKQVLSP